MRLRYAYYTTTFCMTSSRFSALDNTVCSLSSFSIFCSSSDICFLTTNMTFVTYQPIMKCRVTCHVMCKNMPHQSCDIPTSFNCQLTYFSLSAENDCRLFVSIIHKAIRISGHQIWTKSAVSITIVFYVASSNRSAWLAYSNWCTSLQLQCIQSSR